LFAIKLNALRLQPDYLDGKVSALYNQASKYMERMIDMYSFLTGWLPVDGQFLPAVAYAICVFAGLVVCMVLRRTVLWVLRRFFKPFSWAAALDGNGFFKWLAILTLPVVFLLVAADIGMHIAFWSRFIEMLFVVVVVFLIDSLIRSIADIYGSYEVSKTVPLRGVFQVMEIVVFVVGAIILISIFADRSPTALLGGIGAMTAIITIVFKDAILGFVAGIQLAVNDMVRVGDIIEIPQRGILGKVMDISLITVKMESPDKTIVSIPAYTFMSEPFVNRRGIVDAGARRIKRSFNIDACTVRVCDEEMLARFREMPNVADVAQEGMTNIGVLREYVTAYLQERADISSELTVLVRQLQAEDVGIPLEIYVFANAVDLVPYENIQSDVFDHIYAILPEFGLKLYQRV